MDYKKQQGTTHHIENGNYYFFNYCGAVQQLSRQEWWKDIAVQDEVSAHGTVSCDIS